MRNIALTAIGLLGLWYFFGQGTAAKNLKVFFSSLDIKKGSGFTLPDFFANFRLLNPANSPLNVRNITGEIFVNGKQFAVINSVDKFTVPPSGEIVAKIKIRLPVISIVTSIVNLIKGGQKLTVNFKGSVNSNGILIPIDQTIYQGINA